MTNKAPKKISVSASDYVEMAKEMNAVAGETLKLKTQNATTIAAKISLGLSLQAMELAGKGMLCALGYTPEQIKKNHTKHKVLDLLRNVEQELKQRPNNILADYRRFLLWAPSIDGTKFGNTIASYLEEHFSKGASARPRSYFYPDEPVFTGPVPIQALFIMTQHIIKVADELICVLRCKRKP